MKKAQGLPISTIIIMVLAILVLLVLAALLTGQAYRFGLGVQKATKTCAEIGGTEEDALTGCTAGKEPVYGVQTEPGKVCCKTKQQ